jgi:thiol-disulfide isomerase/thioredoxin
MSITLRGWRIGVLAVLATALLVSPGYAGGKKTAGPAAAGGPTPAPEAPAKPKRKLLSLTLTDLNGRSVKLSTWRGHPLIVDFWATWCPPCRKEVPELNAIYKKYRARGLVVVGVSVDKVQGDGVKSVRPFAREFKVNYPILMADDAVVEAMDLDNIPTTLFIDRKGKTIARLEGRGKSGELAQAAKTLFRD